MLVVVERLPSSARWAFTHLSHRKAQSDARGVSFGVLSQTRCARFTRALLVVKVPVLATRERTLVGEGLSSTPRLGLDEKAMADPRDRRIT